jgi:hypothetical protein
MVLFTESMHCCFAQAALALLLKAYKRQRYYSIILSEGRLPGPQQLFPDLISWRSV